MASRRFDVFIAILCLAPAVVVMAQQADDEDREPPPAPASPPAFQREEIRSVMEKVQQLGPWSEQADWITQAQQAMWERNGWDSESDQFAQQLATAVQKLPPWRLDQRLDTVCKMAAERYDLDDQQQARLRSQMLREGVGMLVRHAPTFAKNANLMLDRRLQGEPLDAETVAQIVKNAQPVIDQMIPEMERVMDEFEQNLRPEQREQFHADREAMQQRRDDVMKQMNEWAAGKWSPEAWGMDHDPLVREQRGEPVDGSPADSAAPAPGPGGPGFESAWEAYVRQFVVRYDLDPAQQASAYAILEDLQQQAAKHYQRHEHEIENLKAAMRGSPDEIRAAGERLDELEAPIDALFEQLKARLDRIPTSTQKRAVESSPASRTPAAVSP